MVLQLVVHPQIPSFPVVCEVWSSIRVDRERYDRVNLCMLTGRAGDCELQLRHKAQLRMSK